jgi:hypothetical protein
MACYTTKEMWQTVCIFAINHNFEMFCCKIMVYIGFQRRITYFDCQYNQKLAVAYGLVYIPSRRRTFDIRLKTMFTNIKKRISTMGYLFVTEGLVDLSIIAIDSTLLKAKGSV